MSDEYKGKKGTVNQTGRQRIKQVDYTLLFKWPGDGITCASLNEVAATIPDIFSANSKVFVDVWFRRTYMRFECGTKAEISLPADVKLTDIGRNPFKAQIRVVDHTGNGLVVARTASSSQTPPETKKKKIKKKNVEGEKQVQLFVVEPGGLDTDSTPIRLAFPTAQEPVKLIIHPNCTELFDELSDVSRAGIWVLSVLPHLRCILLRLVADCQNEEFDPSEDIHPNSQWQVLWNSWASSMHGDKGLQDVDDIDDVEETDEWIDSVLSNFCLTIGNPVKQVNRLMKMGGA